MSDEALKQIAKDVAAIKAALGAGAAAFAAALGVQISTGSGAGSTGGSAGAVASAAELDGQYGNEEIKFDPPQSRWNGESFKGRMLSEASPEYLDVWASFRDWQADQDDKDGKKDSKGRPKSYWGRKGARLARGWAARMRAGWKPKSNGVGGGGFGGKPVTDEDYDDGFGGADDDIPFIANATVYGRWDRP